jgi:hypothetical protein
MKSGDYCRDAGDLVWIDLNPNLGHEPRRPLCQHAIRKACIVALIDKAIQHRSLQLLSAIA